MIELVSKADNAGLEVLADAYRDVFTALNCPVWRDIEAPKECGVRNLDGTFNFEKCDFVIRIHDISFGYVFKPCANSDSLNWALCLLSRIKKIKVKKGKKKELLMNTNECQISSAKAGEQK